MTNISILDCTLRDGGYIIDWMFGEKNIQSVMNNLSYAKIDYIECGFLKNCIENKEKSFFSSINNLEKIAEPHQQYTLMVNFGEYPIENFSECINKNFKIRVAFKKQNQNEALEYINKLKKLNWDVFANPMNTNTYEIKELIELINKINTIEPYGLFIVDTLGNMDEEEVIKIFQLIDSHLKTKISIGFHSHNSMQLSFSNTKALLKMKIKRDIIIDSCLFGMGRGAGNLCTELITKYLNDNFNKQYKVSQIIKLINENIRPIYNEKPWGYSTPYYIAAILGCHPNYAGFLINKGLKENKIEELLSQIPNDKKISYDKNFCETFFNNH